MNNYRPYPSITPAVKIIIIINVIMYFMTEIIDKKTGSNLSNTLGLHLPQSEYWAPYQYITHMFMHGSISHLFFNMFALFMFGRVLESIWVPNVFWCIILLPDWGLPGLNSAVGWWEYDKMYEQFQAFQNTPQPEILAEFIRAHISHRQAGYGNLSTIGRTTNVPQYIQAGEDLFRRVITETVNIPTIGASGAIFGILLAFGMLFPNTELFLMFIPIPIKAKYFVIGYGLLEFFLGIQNSAGDNVAHFAHLGGMLFGFILIKYWGKNRKKFY